MTRTKLCDRAYPDYTHGEELFNTISHAFGVVFGVFALITCLSTAIADNNVWNITGAAIYGGSLILLYAMSSIYHGLPCNLGKKVMQVLDHCTIFVLIAGTYTPIVLGPIREYSPLCGWGIFGFVWGCAIIGGIFTAIDWEKYQKFSMACYLGMGWCIVMAIDTALKAVPAMGLLWILFGGISYTIGAGLYALGSKHRYIHSVFHIFVVLGSILQYIGIIFYVI